MPKGQTPEIAMTIAEKQPSLEPCEESGWTAYDYRLSAPLERDDVPKLRALGQLTFLSHLREPFFRVQSAQYTIRGFAGRDLLRVGIDRACLDELGRIEEALRSL